HWRRKASILPGPPLDEKSPLGSILLQKLEEHGEGIDCKDGILRLRKVRATNFRSLPADPRPPALRLLVRPTVGWIRQITSDFADWCEGQDDADPADGCGSLSWFTALRAVDALGLTKADCRATDEPL